MEEISRLKKCTGTVVPLKKEDEYISFDDISESEIIPLFDLLSLEMGIGLALKKFAVDWTVNIMSCDIPLDNFGLFCDSLKRVYICINGFRGYAKSTRPKIGFHIQWIFESPYWSPRVIELKLEKGTPMAWFNLVSRSWEITYVQEGYEGLRRRD
ncbi:hypothetical protein ACHOLT_00370 [Desulfitobacterium sp. Sab5]|uniref:hypothetical protein n=1 Tax=Desulfitobacterium nosdiversum TaxID=3375356 RepID=UPI003CFA6D60